MHLESGGWGGIFGDPLGEGKSNHWRRGAIDRHMGDCVKLGWDAEFFHQFL